MEKAIAEIFEKLYELEKRMGSKDDPISHRQQGGTKTGDGRQARGTVKTTAAKQANTRAAGEKRQHVNTSAPERKSANPDYKLLTRSIFKHVQLDKASANWELTVPKAVEKVINSVKFISLPME